MDESRVERQVKPRVSAGERLEKECQRESWKDGFDVRHGQRHEMETGARRVEKASARDLLLRNRDVEVLDVYSICFSCRFLEFSS